MPPGVKFLQVLTDAPNLNRVQANVAEALRRVVDDTNAAVAAVPTTNVTLGVFGAAPNASAASVAANVLTLQPTDGTHPGGISLSAQTLGAGDKTFSTRVIAGSFQASGATLPLTTGWTDDGAGNFSIYPSGALSLKIGAAVAFPTTTAAVDLGTAALRFKDLWASGNLFTLGNVGAVGYVKGEEHGVYTKGDSTGTPGNATLNTGAGKSAIAIAATSCTITNSRVTASTDVLFSQLDRDVTCKELIVSVAAGSFTVTGNGAATAALKFQWFIVTD